MHAPPCLPAHHHEPECTLLPSSVPFHADTESIWPMTARAALMTSTTVSLPLLSRTHTASDWRASMHVVQPPPPHNTPSQALRLCTIEEPQPYPVELSSATQRPCVVESRRLRLNGWQCDARHQNSRHAAPNHPNWRTLCIHDGHALTVGLLRHVPRTFHCHAPTGGPRFRLLLHHS